MAQKVQVKYHYDLSVIVPSVRPENLNIVYEHLHYSCKKYNWEMIVSSPKSLPVSLEDKLNIKHIRQFGHPSRSFHLGTKIADGKIICVIADDSHQYPDSLDKSMDLLLSKDLNNTIVQMRYREGVNFSASEFPLAYWHAYHHPDTRRPGVNHSWKLTLTPMMSLELYNKLGGVSCVYDHLNMNAIDLGFRHQKNGGEVLLSPIEVMNCNFEPNRTSENSAVIDAYVNNDKDRFYEAWKDQSRSVIIEEDWRESDPSWKRRKNK